MSGSLVGDLCFDACFSQLEPLHFGFWMALMRLRPLHGYICCFLSACTLLFLPQKNQKKKNEKGTKKLKAENRPLI
jgi:hypothetical protein